MTCWGVLAFPSGSIQGGQAGYCLPPWNGCQQGWGYLVLQVQGTCSLWRQDKAFWEEQWQIQGSQWQKQNDLRGRAAQCTWTVAISSKEWSIGRANSRAWLLWHPCCPSVLRSKNPWMDARTKFWLLDLVDTKSWLVCSWRWGVSRVGWVLLIFCLFISWFSWLFLCMYKHFLPVFPCLCYFPWWIDVAAVIERWWGFFLSIFKHEVRWINVWVENATGKKRCTWCDGEDLCQSSWSPELLAGHR